MESIIEILIKFQEYQLNNKRMNEKLPHSVVAQNFINDYTLKIQTPIDSTTLNSLQNWEIETIDRYYYLSSRNGKTYVEITFWIEKNTAQRKETKREISIYDGEEYSLPDWAKSIKERRKNIEPILW